MSRHYILDARGEPTPVDDVLVWARWFDSSATARHIGFDRIGDVVVSTVFLGLDHAIFEEGPVLFETMVFGGALDGEQVRYSTTDAAIDGHVAMCARVRDAERVG